MTPSTNDNGRWLEAALGVIAFLWTALGVLYWRLWDGIASKEWVLSVMANERDADHARDRELIAALQAPLLIEIESIKAVTDRMHRDNREVLERIDKKLDYLVGQ